MCNLQRALPNDRMVLLPSGVEMSDERTSPPPAAPTHFVTAIILAARSEEPRQGARPRDHRMALRGAPCP